MRVLVTTNRLVSFSGSEVIALEIAEAFAAKGHPVQVFVNAASPELIEHARNRGVPVNQDCIPSQEEFDIVWAQHSIFPLLLSDRDPDPGQPRPYTVLVHLSSIEPHETPLPVVEELFAHAILVSNPELCEKFERYRLPAGRMRVFPNPAPRAFLQARHPLPATVRRVLNITNHQPAEVRDALEFIHKEAAVEVRHVGYGSVMQRITPADIRDCDAVVTIGKTTQYALLAGVPVYCYDVFGGPGWLNEANFERTALHNFSGRCRYRKCTAREIADEILTGYGPAARFAAQIPGAQLEKYTLEPYIDRLIEAARSRDPWTEREVRRVRRYSGQIARLRALCQVIRNEVQAVAWLGSMDGEQLQMARRVQDLENSLSWRITQPLRMACDLAGRLAGQFRKRN